MGVCTSLRRFSSLISVMVPRISATNWKSYDYWNANTLFWFFGKIKIRMNLLLKSWLSHFSRYQSRWFSLSVPPSSPAITSFITTISLYITYLIYMIFSYILYHHCIDGKLDDFLFLHSNGLLDVWILNNVGSQSCFNQNKPSKHLSLFLLKLFDLTSTPRFPNTVKSSSSSIWNIWRILSSNSIVHFTLFDGKFLNPNNYRKIPEYTLIWYSHSRCYP